MNADSILLLSVMVIMFSELVDGSPARYVEDKSVKGSPLFDRLIQAVCGQVISYDLHDIGKSRSADERERFKSNAESYKFISRQGEKEEEEEKEYEDKMEEERKKKKKKKERKKERKEPGTIMCSTCRSDTNPKCEMDPPPPQPCPGLGSGGVESCSTVRIFNEETGKLAQFVRSCSDSLRQGCFDNRPGYKTCADICYTDGCNAAASLATPTHITRVLIALFLSALFVKLKIGGG